MNTKKLIELRKTHLSVDEVIAILRKLSNEGRGNYLLALDERAVLLFKRNVKPSVNDRKMMVDVSCSDLFW